VRCFFERETQRGLNISTALWTDTTGTATTPASTEHLTKNVAEVGATRIEAHATTWESS
jgi:hypothetical protein